MKAFKESQERLRSHGGSLIMSNSEGRFGVQSSKWINKLVKKGGTAEEYLSSLVVIYWD